MLFSYVLKNVQTISEGCCSENVRVGITLETIRYVGGAPYLMMQTLPVKLMNVLDLLSFSYPRLLLETLLPRRLKKIKLKLGRVVFRAIA